MTKRNQGRQLSPSEAAAPPERFCATCAHFLPGDLNVDDLFRGARCAAVTRLDRVSGRRFNVECDLARSFLADCGPEGRLWEPASSGEPAALMAEAMALPEDAEAGTVQ